MNWGSVAEWATILVALVTAGWAAVTAQTRDDSRRQAASANRIAMQANRIAQDANTLSEQALQLAEQAAKTHVAWHVENERRHTYLLTNVGSGPAYDVDVSYAGELEVLSDPSRVLPNESFRFVAFATTGGTPRTLTVTYAESPGGERQTWETAKPSASQQ